MLRKSFNLHAFFRKSCKVKCKYSLILRLVSQYTCGLAQHVTIVIYWCAGEEVRRYIAGYPGPPGSPGAAGPDGYAFNTQGVAERVLSLMNGECC